MHSSRKRTVRFNGHLYEIFPGVSAWGEGVYLGGCLPGGVQGMCVQGGVCLGCPQGVSGGGGATDSIFVETIE